MLGLRRQLKIIWNLIQENSEDNYEFSSAEKRALDTQTLVCERFEPRSHFKSRLSLIVRVNVVLNRTVVVDSD